MNEEIKDIMSRVKRFLCLVFIGHDFNMKTRECMYCGYRAELLSELTRSRMFRKKEESQ